MVRPQKYIKKKKKKKRLIGADWEPQGRREKSQHVVLIQHGGGEDRKHHQSVDTKSQNSINPLVNLKTS